MFTGVMADDLSDDRSTCAFCGVPAGTGDLPLTWATSVENGRELVYCDHCARDNLRSIESKLDSAWW
jgi:hypothetical protein